MNPDNSLPGDLSKWPADPFALLGLSHSASAKEAKRAYLKLVRQYKPEHEPEKFQRLRKAFEQAQQQIEFRTRYAMHWDEEEESEVNEQAETAALAEPAAPQSEPQMSPETQQFLSDFGHGAQIFFGNSPLPARNAGVGHFSNDLDDLWGAACRGEEALAYACLLEQRHLNRSSSEVYIRLYWLLTANRGLDPERIPCDWLVEGLRAVKMTGPLRELYRREMAANPYEAVGDRCGSLLEVSVAPGALADLLESRWRGASRLGRWDILLDDLRRARPKIVFDDEEAWARLLLLVIDYLAWLELREARPVLESCRRELDQLSHLHARLGDDYDRLDLLFDVVAGWQRLRFATDVPAWWTSLLPISWNQPAEIFRARFAPLLKNLGEWPQQALRTFDALARHSKAAAAQLGYALERLRYLESAYDDRRDNDAVKFQVRRFARATRSTYQTSRERLLQLCLQESLDPLWVGPVVDDLPRDQRGDDDSWADAISADGPLRYVYLGYRAYWG